MQSSPSKLLLSHLIAETCRTNYCSQNLSLKVNYLCSAAVFNDGCSGFVLATALSERKHPIPGIYSLISQ